MRTELNEITWDYILSSSGGKMNVFKCATEYYSQQLLQLGSIETEQEWKIFKEKYKIEIQYKIKELIYQNRLKKIEGDFNETKGI